MYFIPILLFSAWVPLWCVFYDSVTRLLPDNRIIFVKGQKYKANLVTAKMWLKQLVENYVYLDMVALLHLKLYLCKVLRCLRKQNRPCYIWRRYNFVK